MNAGATKIAMSQPALRVDCPTCIAKAGERCRKIHGRTMDGGVVAYRAPHKKRKHVAAKLPPETPTQIARKALMALPPEERKALIAELWPCTCRAITTVVKEAPEIGVGAVIGGLAGLVLKLFQKDEK